MRKLKIRIAAIALAIFAAVLPLSADTFTLGSAPYQSDQWNSIGENIAVFNSGTWSSPFTGTTWVSFALTGDEWGPGYVSVGADTSVTFTHVFHIGGTPQNSTLKVMAADTASVYVNGTLIQALPNPFQTGYYGCDVSVIGCRFNVEGVFTIPAAVLHPGINKLEVKVVKKINVGLNGSPTGFGANWLLTVNYEPSGGCQQ